MIKFIIFSAFIRFIFFVLLLSHYYITSACWALSVSQRHLFSVSEQTNFVLVWMVYWGFTARLWIIHRGSVLTRALFGCFHVELLPARRRFLYTIHQRNRLRCHFTGSHMHGVRRVHNYILAVTCTFGRMTSIFYDLQRAANKTQKNK